MLKSFLIALSVLGLALSPTQAATKKAEAKPADTSADAKADDTAKKTPKKAEAKAIASGVQAAPDTPAGGGAIYPPAGFATRVMTYDNSLPGGAPKRNDGARSACRRQVVRIVTWPPRLAPATHVRSRKGTKLPK